ncbi:hypothetical protein CWS35_36500 [Bradyrhizobium sp. SK17]|nr:hypothetical protein CWS35_36500 [Bradyrhizobium sp. SK17]
MPPGHRSSTPINTMPNTIISTCPDSPSMRATVFCSTISSAVIAVAPSTAPNGWDIPPKMHAMRRLTLDVSPNGAGLRNLK